jgi:hypothetical protein
MPKMKPKKGSIIAAGLLALSALTAKAPAQEISLNSSVINEEAVSGEGLISRIDIAFNLEAETKPEKVEYDFRKCSTDKDYSFVSHSFMPEMDNNVNSPFQIPLDEIKNLTDNQKLVFLSVFSNEIYCFAYDTDTNCCRHISSNIEKIANQIGLPAAAVSGVSSKGGGHVYNLIKTEEGISVVDSYHILSSKSKNTEKILEAYQKETGSMTFQHWFFNNSKPKYELITDDGKNFLDFIDYDPSTNSIRESLLNRNINSPDLIFGADKKDNLLSFLAGFFGTSLKLGSLSNNTSPEEKYNISQVGFKKEFRIPKLKIKFLPEVGVAATNNTPNFLYEINYGLAVSTENEKGINALLKYSRAIINSKATLFYDHSIFAGISYSFPFGNAELEPYLLSKFSFLPDTLEEYNEKLKLNGLEAGLIFSAPNISFEPHYTYRLWENEFGAKLNAGTKNIKVNLEASVSKSTYEFCPDKLSINLGVDFSIGSLTLNSGYKAEGTNYDGEKELTSSFYFNGKIKLK